MLNPVAIRGKPLISQPVGCVEHFGATQYSELRIVAGRKHDEGISGGEDLIRHDGGVRCTPSCGFFARYEIIGTDVG